MADTGELLHANLHEVFGNRDAASRRTTIDRIFAPDVSFVDPDEVVVGRDALEAKAAHLLDTAPPEFVFTAEGPAYLADDTGAQAWAFGPPGAPVVRGLDILTVRDGLVVELRTLLAAPAA